MQPLTTASVAATTTTNVAAVAIGAVVGVCPCALYACLCDIAIVGKVILWVNTLYTWSALCFVAEDKDEQVTEDYNYVL